MARVVRLLLAYDGTGFRGWAAQRDPSIRTVEGELSAAIERIVNERIELSVAGRTDAGVHARGQVTSFSAMTSLAPERIRDAVNAMLGPELVVRRAWDATRGEGVTVAVIDTGIYPVDDLDPSRLVKGWNYYQAARMGNAGGAIVVTRHGCANFMAYEEEALKFVADRGGF